MDRFRPEVVAGTPRVIDTTTGQTASKFNGQPAWFPTFSEAQGFARAENAADSRATRAAQPQPSQVPSVRRVGPPLLPFGYRLATVGDLSFLRAFSQLLVYDAQLAIVRSSRIRAFKSGVVCLTVGREDPADLTFVDDAGALLPEDAPVHDGRFWLLVVTR